MTLVVEQILNRASLLLRLKEEFPKAYETYLAANASVYCMDWDDPEEDEDAKQIIEALKEEKLMK